MLYSINYNYYYLQKGDNSDVIYLDYAKAFDKVDHEILLKKLYSYGIKGKFYDWIKDFLTDRFQTVCVDGHCSFLARVISGVPQGSVLGPILFIIFINDLDDAVLDSILGKFADDTQVQRNISQASDCDFLQKDLDNIITWSKHNNMELHEDKFELLSYNTYKTEKNSQRSNLLKAFAELPFNLPPKYQTPNNSIIKAKSLVRDLGVQLSSDYSWTPHINIMVDAARRTTSWVLSVFSDRSPETMMTLQKPDQKQTRILLPPMESPPHQRHPADRKRPKNLHIKDSRLPPPRLPRTSEAPRPLLPPTKTREIIIINSTADTANEFQHFTK